MTAVVNEVERRGGAGGADGTRRTVAPSAIEVDAVSKTYPIPLAGARRALGMKAREPVVALTDVSLDVLALVSAGSPSGDCTQAPAEAARQSTTKLGHRLRFDMQTPPRYRLA